MDWCLKQNTACITFESILYTCGVHLYNFDPPSEILDPPLLAGYSYLQILHVGSHHWVVVEIVSLSEVYNATFAYYDTTTIA